MRHLDLFSGIGCWALAGREVWGQDHEMVGFCEIDPFCRAVLSKHYPDVPIYGDIKTLADAESEQNRRVRQPGVQSDTRTSNLYSHELDLLTASPPCQAASSAGARKGTDDDRWLWNETFAVIARTRPRWVILENVRGLLSLEGGVVFDDLLSRMEKDGYEVWPFIAPVAGVGAPHRRERVWIVGHRTDTTNSGCKTDPKAAATEKGSTNTKPERAGKLAGRPRGSHRSIDQFERERTARRGDADDCEQTPAPYAASAGLSQPRQTGERELSTEGGTRVHGRPELADRHAPDAISDGRGKGGRNALRPEEQNNRSSNLGRCRGAWSQDWREVALATCHDRVDDGTPARVYGPDRISEAAHRRERLKACGNAIVPQVAVEIMRAIKYVDDHI